MVRSRPVTRKLRSEDALSEIVCHDPQPIRADVLHSRRSQDINSMVKKVAVIFDLLGKQDIKKNERMKKSLEKINHGFRSRLPQSGQALEKISKTQKKFVETFQQYINNFIVEKIDLYTNQKIDIGDSKIVKEERNLKSVSSPGVKPYRLISNCGKTRRWRVYDGYEGVSLITTFRSQFSGVLKKFL